MSKAEKRKMKKVQSDMDKYQGIYNTIRDETHGVAEEKPALDRSSDARNFKDDYFTLATQL